MRKKIKKLKINWQEIYILLCGSGMIVLLQSLQVLIFNGADMMWETIVSGVWSIGWFVMWMVKSDNYKEFRIDKLMKKGREIDPFEEWKKSYKG
jgi:hypothetical protein